MAQVELKNVRKSFGPVRVIDRLNLFIPDGAFTVFVGPSGCGKSTLVRTVNRLVTPQSGTVYVDGADVRDLEPTALAPGLTRDELIKALEGHAKQATGLIGTFSKP